MTTQNQKVEFIRAQLAENTAWAIRGMLRIFENQTLDEQNSDSTNHENGIGFNGTDATFLSSCAKQVLAGRRMSAKQMHYIFKKMPKYARQLLSVSDPEKLDTAMRANAQEAAKEARKASYNDSLTARELDANIAACALVGIEETASVQDSQDAEDELDAWHHEQFAAFQDISLGY